MELDVGEEFEDLAQPREPNGEIVRWMEPRPMRVGPTGVSLAVAGAFALGALAAVTTLALAHWIRPQGRLRLPQAARRLSWRRRGPESLAVH